MEKEIKPGVFISVVTREQWVKRVDTLTGDDLAHFISKCNPASLASRILFRITGIRAYELLKICQELEPEFDPLTDYFVVRNTPK